MMGRPDELGELRVNRLLREWLTGGLGDAEVDHLGDRGDVVQFDQDVVGFEVASYNFV